ncbi:MAG: TerB family tellurite resistance protein [Acidobacteria bacterium]|nr:TerB family tellurite resistance protein [Acidobacteriota bacterium]
MSILDRLRALRSSPSGASQGDTDTVRRIVGELDRLEPRRARYLAAFAYVLSRVAGADLSISAAETAKMIDLVRHAGRLPEAQAVIVVEIAKSQNRLFGGTENFLVTRELREVATDAERQELLECLFAVSAADDAIDGEEEAQIWQIASELGFEHADYVRVRMAYSAKRTVWRKGAR